MRVGSIVRIVTGLAGDGFVNRVGDVGVGVAQITDVADKAGSGVTADTGDAANGAGRRPGRDGVQGIVPFGALDVVGCCVMTLRAGSRAVADGYRIGISRHAMRKQMLTAGTVTVFALDVQLCV